MYNVAMEKHKVYDGKFKLKAVDVARKKSIATAAREFVVDRKRIWEWLKQEDELLQFRNSDHINLPLVYTWHTRITSFNVLVI